MKKNPKAKSNYFTGKVVAKDVSAIIKPEEEKIYHVTFQNGARTKLHYHNAGQTLIITKGTGSLALYKKSGSGKPLNLYFYKTWAEKDSLHLFLGPDGQMSFCLTIGQGLSYQLQWLLR